MLFSSTTFLFWFLPPVLGLYFLIPRRARTARNILLLLASLVFYAWGERWFVLVMLCSIALNYVLGRLAQTRPRPAVALAAAGNLGLLFVFKYLTFTLRNLNRLGFGFVIPAIELPIGVSFFTFQALSYVIDVSRGKAKAQKNPLNVGLYISFFPQLIAGPIVKYQTVAEEIEHRQENWADFSTGASRFLLGLAKKVLLSNQLALAADAAFDRAGELSAAMAWLGAVCYSLQIFFDFSGYSDMAIGLGRMFGFHFLENFNYPYLSRTVTEFWRRWHISLSTWFRDYIYFPLGGSRVKSRLRLVFNLFVVWLATGIWHGANWTFILWGVLYGVAVTVEKLTDLPGWAARHKVFAAFYRIFTLLLVVLCWMLFRSDSIAAAGRYLMDLFCLGEGACLWSAEAGLYLRENLVILCFALLACAPTATALREKLARRSAALAALWDALAAAATVALFLVSVSFLVKGTYNPFIYFNF